MPELEGNNGAASMIEIVAPSLRGITGGLARGFGK
jgi:hypothetical protein